MIKYIQYAQIKVGSFFRQLNWFGHRDLEKEAQAVSRKMKRGGEKGVMSPVAMPNPTREELKLMEKDRTPG